ncbi:MAG: FAD binding domain-containing protein [Chitinophagaceae bacterium]
MISFILNNNLVTTDKSQGSTVLDYVRYSNRLAGTKIGCREGDCGACTVLVGDIENDQLIYHAVTCCLMPLGNAHGKHIVTVEGINMQKLSPVQQAMVDTNGTQCGFCTPGFIMSFTGFVLNEHTKTYEEAIAAIDGNICRCTGYKSIERSAQTIAEKLSSKQKENTIAWLVENGFIPGYFVDIKKRLKELKESNKFLPGENGTFVNRMMMGGGTDLVVQKPLKVKNSRLQFLFDAKELKEIKLTEDQIHIGASVTVTEFAKSELIQKSFPELEKNIKLISSTPIRNMATMAGNLVNASPIGDMSIFFLALDADLVLNRNGNKRILKLKEFYKAYKIIDKEADEIVEKIIFPAMQKDSVFNFEKVSKRTHLDIASVNTACTIQSNKDDSIATIHLSAGGVAPFPKYLRNTCSFLTGKKITAEIMEQAFQIMDEEIAPISDTRGSEAYKRLLLRQLIIAHIVKFFGLVEPVKKILLQ